MRTKPESNSAKKKNHEINPKNLLDSLIASIIVSCLVEMILTAVMGMLHRTVLYECCPGYMKLEGMHGCPAGI